MLKEKANEKSVFQLVFLKRNILAIFPNQKSWLMREKSTLVENVDRVFLDGLQPLHPFIHNRSDGSLKYNVVHRVRN